MSTMENLQSSFISMEAIKPSSPTPSYLKTYNLSFSDQFSTSMYIPMVFFYPYFGHTSTTHIATHQEKAAQLLKKSLSQTLTHYYPFSGRFAAARPDGYFTYVDCNDEGVEFVAARFNAPLSQIVHHGPHKIIRNFFPVGTLWGSVYDRDPVKVQLNYFECGGLGLAVCLSHKICDLCSMYEFIKHWAAVSHGHYNQQTVQGVPPTFISSPSGSKTSEAPTDKGKNCVTKRFVFRNKKIEQLKGEVGKVNNPTTRVEVVNSLLYRCAVRAAKAANRGNSCFFFKIFILLQTANMRERLANPLQKTTVGNFTFGITVPILSCIESQLALNSLTARLQKGKSKIAGMTISQLNRWQRQMLIGNKYLPRMFFEPFLCTSLCGYQVYGIDFGWGKPTRVTFACPDKFFILIDSPIEDGIEALVSLEEEEMAIFQADEQLLAFAFAT